MPVIGNYSPDKGCRGPQKDKEKRESADKRQRGQDDFSAHTGVVAGGQLLNGKSGDKGKIGRDQWQHTGRQKRKQSGEKRGRNGYGLSKHIETIKFGLTGCTELFTEFVRPLLCSQDCFDNS